MSQRRQKYIYICIFFVIRIIAKILKEKRTEWCGTRKGLRFGAFLFQKTSVDSCIT